MEPIIVATLAVAVWCLAPLPLAVAIGRAFSHGYAPGRDDHAFAALLREDAHDCGSDRTPFHL